MHSFMMRLNANQSPRNATEKSEVASESEPEPSKKPTVAIAGSSGHLGAYVFKALISPQFRSSYSKVIVLQRPESSSHNAESISPAHDKSYTEVAYDESNLSACLKGVDVLINCIGSSGHEFKDKLLRAIPGTGVKLYVPSEFGVDHTVHDFSHPEWDRKKLHHEISREILTDTKVCRVFPGLFMEDSIGPWFGFDTANARYECIGSKQAYASYTSLEDVGKVVAQLARMPVDRVPPYVHIAGDTVNIVEIAKMMEDAGSSKIEIKEVDMKGYKTKTLEDKTSDPSRCLRFLMGDRNLDHTMDGLGNANQLVNPDESNWKWKKMSDYAKEKGGRPWADAKWSPDGGA